MFDFINNEKNNNRMLYINELYSIKAFEEIELKINNIIDKIDFAKNYLSSEPAEYSYNLILYCCHISYKIFQGNHSSVSLKNFYILYTYLLISQLNTNNFYDNEYNSKVLLAIKKNLVFEKINDVIYFSIKNEDFINVENLKDYISVEDFLQINISLKSWSSKIKELFIFEWNRNFKKWPLKTSSIIINLYYLYLSEENDNIILIKNELLNLNFGEYNPYNLMYKLFLIAFSIELKNNPSSNKFFEILNQHSFFNNNFDCTIYNLRDDFLFLAAAFLNFDEFEKIISNDFKYVKSNLSNDEQQKYLKYRIPYFKQIYEYINGEIVDFNLTIFNEAIEKNKCEEDNLKLIPKEHPWSDEISETEKALIKSLTIYNLIGTKESIFSSFSMQQKNEYIKNYLLSNLSEKEGSLKNLISVIELDSEKNKLLDNLKNLLGSNSNEQNNLFKIKIDYIINYFEYFYQRKEIHENLIYFENADFSQEFNNKLEEIKNLVLECFEPNIKKFYFIFINDSTTSFANKIYNFYINCVNNGQWDIFDNFYLDIKEKMESNYKKIYQIIQYYSKLTWNNDYIYFSLVSLFIDPNILKIEPYFDIKFIANYIQHDQMIKKNNWNIAEIISYTDYTYVIWIIYMLYNHYNSFYSSYKNFNEIFLSKIEIDDIDNYFNNLIIMSNAPNIENPRIGTGVTYMYPFDLSATCILNLLIHYIVKPQNKVTLFEMLKLQLPFVISRKFITEILYNLFDLYHWINIDPEWKKRITSVLDFIKEEVRKKLKDSSLEISANFSQQEIKILKNKGKIMHNFHLNSNEFRNLYYKKIYWIINYHLWQYNQEERNESSYIELIELENSVTSNLIKRYKKFLK